MARSPRRVGLERSLALAIVLTPLIARAEVRLRADAGGGRFVGGWQGHEIGVGGVYGVSAELFGTRRLGFEARLFGGQFLTGSGAPEPGLARANDPSFLGLTLGLRAHPFADLSGVWIAAGFGGARTGSLLRPAFDLRLGQDFRVGTYTTFGPWVGYTQFIQPDSGALRPDDGRALMLGVGFGFDEGLPRAPKPPPTLPLVAVKAAPPVVAEPEPPKCPGVPEGYDGPVDENGCPKPEAPVVKVVGAEIKLPDRIYFEFAHADVRAESFPLLQALAAFIVAHPEYGVVQIHGHTDEIGGDEWNQKLSEARAGSVRKLLVEYGVPAHRLVAKGFGKKRPRNLGKDDLARQENRRVEVIIEHAPTDAKEAKK